MKFVTWNINKRKEANAIVWWKLEQVVLDLEEIQEIDVVKIVEAKAKAAYEALGEPALCEDVSLVFDAWKGLPWPQIKWFIQTVGREGVLQMLSSFENRKAKAICCVGWYDGQKAHHVLGVCEGSIAQTVRWVTDFGFDPIFIPEGYDQTFVEMPREIKNQVSHRYLAWKQVKDLIE